MKPEILNNDHMMFLDRALDTQRTALLTAMADAVAECRTAADQAAELTETGEIGLLRLVEILCAAKVQRGQTGGAVLEGTEVQILADALAQLYPHLQEIDETANSRLEQMMPRLAEAAGATEELKARDPMQWVGLMNTCKAQAEEILMAELINS